MKPMWSHRAVAVLAGMTAPKGSAEACKTRKTAPEKVFMVLCGHESARRGAVHCLSTDFQRYRNTASLGSFSLALEKGKGRGRGEEKGEKRREKEKRKRKDYEVMGRAPAAF